MVGLVPQGGTSGLTAGDWTKATLVVAASPVKSEGNGLWSSTITITVLNKDGHPFAKAPVKVRKAGMTVKECEMDDEGRATYAVTDLTPGKHIFEVSLPAGRPKSAEITIKLVTLFELGEANLEKDKDTFVVVGTGQVKSGDDAPAKQHEVRLQLDVLPEVIIETDDNGSFSHTWTDVPKGNRIFSAMPMGGMKKIQRKDLKSDAPAKRIGKIIPIFASSGSNPRRVDIQVVDEEKKAPMKGVDILVATTDGTFRANVKTDAAGRATVEVHLTSVRNLITFQAGDQQEQRFIYR